MKTKFTIVVADDDSDDQELIRIALSKIKKDLDIIPLQNGVQVLDFLLKRQAFKHVKTTADLIFLDLNMPMLDGFDVIKEIRKIPKHQGLPIYVITISKSKDDLSKARELGATGFYNKGSSLADIGLIVNEICGKSFESSNSN